MSLELRQRIFSELDQLVLIDPHTHINPHSPASTTLADILGYHYYTELAHSAGLPKSQIEEPDLPPKEKVSRLMAKMNELSNTIQYSWFVEMAQRLLGFEGEHVNQDNWEMLYDTAAEKMAAPDWADHVLRESKLESVFLTNDFDDPLEGFDTSKYIPCLRTDDLVFHWGKPDVRDRLAACSGVEAVDSQSMRKAIGGLFDHFTQHGARACAISLPPNFAPQTGFFRASRSCFRTAEGAWFGGRGGRSNGGFTFRVLDVGGVLRGVSVAVRPDDRCESRGLS